jgi:hypothetical protein
MADFLDERPPAGIPTESEFGGYVPDGAYPSECVGWKLQSNNYMAWVEFKITSGLGSDQGRFSLSLFLPLKEQLNIKVREGKSKGMDAEEARDFAQKAFFRYGQTLSVAGIPVDTPIREALDKLVGWRGMAEYENRQGFGTNVKQIMGDKPLSGGSTGSPEKEATATGEDDLGF